MAAFLFIVIYFGALRSGSIKTLITPKGFILAGSLCLHFCKDARARARARGRSRGVTTNNYLDTQHEIMRTNCKKQNKKSQLVKDLQFATREMEMGDLNISSSHLLNAQQKSIQTLTTSRCHINVLKVQLNKANF